MKVQHAIAAVCAVILTVVAFSPQLDRLADASFAWHMAQHMLLIFGIIPFALLAAPMFYILRWSSNNVAKGIVNILHWPPVRALTHPVTAWLIFVAVLWGTHLTPLYNLALENEHVHVGEHLAYAVAALLFWQNVIQIGPSAWPLGYPLRLVYIFTAIPPCAFLGLVLFRTNHVLYSTYSRTQQFPLADQHNGAALMWILGGLLMFSIFMILAGLWAREERRMQAASILAIALFALFATHTQVLASNPGKDLYDMRCASCHGAHLQGSPDGPPLIGVPKMTVDFYVGTGRMPAQLPYGETLSAPPQLLLPERTAIVQYVTAAGHGNPALPRVGSAGDIAQGERLFVSNCASCHGFAAKGGAVGFGWVAPTLMHSTPLQIAEAIRSGPGVMPRFDSSTLSDRDIDAIAGYVNALQRNVPDVGGFSLGDFGPTAEGLAAWALGFGMLFSIVKWIGSNV